MEPKIEANNLRKTAVWKIYAHFQKFIFFSLPFVTSLSLVRWLISINFVYLKKINFLQLDQYDNAFQRKNYP